MAPLFDPKTPYSTPAMMAVARRSCDFYSNQDERHQTKKKLSRFFGSNFLVCGNTPMNRSIVWHQEQPALLGIFDSIECHRGSPHNTHVCICTATAKRPPINDALSLIAAHCRFRETRNVMETSRCAAVSRL